MLKRLESKQKVSVGNVTFGGDHLVRCVPVVSSNPEDLMQDMQDICAAKPDMIEWRLDYMKGADDPDQTVRLLREIASIRGQIPLLLTFRAESEGGFCFYSEEIRAASIRAAILSGLIDLIDLEISGTRDFLTDLRDCAHENQVKVILSYHNIHRTPDEEFIVGQLKTAQDLGADIAKASVQPADFHDVITMLRACRRARTEVLSIPQIIVSKDDIGVLTRVFAYYLGSDLTFFSVSGTSTIGQLSLEDYTSLRELLQLEQ